LRILYIHQYFRTPSEGGAIRSWYIARAMKSTGHDVELITAHNKQTRETKLIDGIKVHYLPVKYDSSFGILRRLWSFLLFSHKAYWKAVKLGHFDKAYITSTPLTVGLTALKLKGKHSIPYIFEVRDLWPEAPIEAGIIKSIYLKKLLRNLELKIYKNASGIVVLSPGILQSVKGKMIDCPIHLCTNISDCDFFEPDASPDQALIEQYNSGQNFVIGYFGAIGRLNALEYLLDFAAYCQSLDSPIKFMIIGSGNRKKRLEKTAENKFLKNIIFIDHLDKYDLRRYLSLIDAAYISFAKLKVLESNSPNKFFDALASGKFIILNFNGWIREYVEKYKCGLYAVPGNEEDLYKKLQPFIKDRRNLKIHQLNARHLAEEKFEYKKLTAELLRFIES
jgi:glycosyltransferase involved in cell wall biosynthesis